MFLCFIVQTLITTVRFIPSNSKIKFNDMSIQVLQNNIHFILTMF